MAARLLPRRLSDWPACMTDAQAKGDVRPQQFEIARIAATDETTGSSSGSAVASEP